MLALRIARAYTGKSKIVKFHEHFHGWHDYSQIAQSDPLDVPMSAGIPQTVQDTVTALPTDLARVHEELAHGDVAALLIEPTGAGWGAIPVQASFVKALPELCRDHGTVFIMDEVDALVPARTDPVSGQPAFKHTPVAVAPWRPAWHGVMLGAGAAPEVASKQEFL